MKNSEHKEDVEKVLTLFKGQNYGKIKNVLFEVIKEVDNIALAATYQGQQDAH